MKKKTKKQPVRSHGEEHRMRMAVQRTLVKVSRELAQARDIINLLKHEAHLALEKAKNMDLKQTKGEKENGN